MLYDGVHIVLMAQMIHVLVDFREIFDIQLVE